VFQTILTLIGTASRVFATVLPTDALELPNDARCSSDEVQVVPTPTQDLALAKTERKGHAPPGSVAKAFGRVEQSVDLLYVERVDSG
jgi:hypothetical protein